MACNILQLVVVGLRACAGKGGIQSEDMQFADYLLGSLGRGCRSCVDLQEAAHAMVLESGGSCSSVTRKISKIGACGRHPQNAERDLFRLLSLPCDAFFRLITCGLNMFVFFNILKLVASFESFLKWRYPKTLKFGGTFILGNLHLCYKGRCREAKDPYNVKICIKDSLRPKRTTSMDLPIILPHEMLDYLHRSKKNCGEPRAGETVLDTIQGLQVFKSPML